MRLIRLGRLDGSELSVMDMIITMSYDGQEEIEEPSFEDFEVIYLLKYSRIFRNLL